jgi:CheY-like chemotaxis protein
LPEDGMIKIRIAVVDDEKMLLHVFSSLMRQFHYHADFFSSPVKAIEAIIGTPGRYQLVISDVRMPEMDGFTFATKIRETLPEMPIMFMTGDVTDELQAQAKQLGRVELLEKPFPLEATLKEAIPKFLGIKP